MRADAAAVIGDDAAMSAPSQPSSPNLPGPPPPVRAAIVLVWVQLAVGVLGTLSLLLVPALREQVLAPAETTPGLPPGFERVLLAIVVLSALAGLVFAVAWAVVAATFLRRGHRWVRTVVLVFASLAVFGLVTLVLQAVLSAVAGPSPLVQAPSPVTVVPSVVGTTLYAVIVVLLFRPASRRWLDERTAWRRWAAQQRRAARG